MNKLERNTDYWVYTLLKEQNINLSPERSNIKDIDVALSTATKNLTNDNYGKPEFVGVIKDYVLVIEDKRDISDHIHTINDVIDIDTKEIVRKYAVNGALHYGIHILKHTNYKKCFAIGISGDEKYHRITPLFINERLEYKQLNDIETFVNLNEKNIDEYYYKEVLNEDTNKEKETEDILKEAKILHEDLRNYGNLKEVDKPLIVSGILLALREAEFGGFKLDDLTGDSIRTDGEKILEAITANLRRSNVSPQTKLDKLLNQFSIIKDSKKLNEINNNLGKTPLKHYAEQLNESIYKNIRFTSSSEDYLGRFYGEFMSYSGGDGQSLGIILTPKHITELFCKLVDLKPTDTVLDPCCGTAGFLIASMHYMLQQADNEYEKKEIKKNRLHGIELQDYMFTIATTNMILRGDGKSNLINEDFIKLNPNKIQVEKQATIGMMNPPYSQGSTDNPELYEINFIEHMLNSLVSGGKGIVIVPQSTMVGKSKIEKTIKKNILKYHTLEGVITCNTNTFYGVGTYPVIAIFTAGEPHPKDKLCKFINFKDDGYEVSPHIGLIKDDTAKDKQQYLLDVWKNKIKAPTKFCVESSVDPSDEWLHSFYYFNDEIPTEKDFDKTIEDYLTFEFSMIMQDREYLFKKNPLQKSKNMPSLLEKEWKEFQIFDDLLSIESTNSGIDGNKLFDEEGKIPYLTRKGTGISNGIKKYISDENKKKGYNKGNVISIGLDTQTAFYQPFEFVTGQNIQVVYSEKINKYSAMFLIPILKKQMDAKFNWGGNGATLSRMKKLKVLLPVNNDGIPDWEYMEQYSKNTIVKKYEKYLDFILKNEI